MANFAFDKFYPFTFRNLFEFSVDSAENGHLNKQDVLRNLQVVKKGHLIETYNSPKHSFRGEPGSEIHQLYLPENEKDGPLILEGSIDKKFPDFMFQIRRKLPPGSSSSGSGSVSGGKRRKKGTRRRRKNKSKNFSMKRWL